MSKDLSVGVLMDFYGELLTEKQRDTMDMYYNNDYSLAEIAQNLDISRQGVRDFIVRGEKQLEEFENKLKMVKKYETIMKNAEEIEKILKTINGYTVDSDKKEIQKRIDLIKKVL